MEQQSGQDALCLLMKGVEQCKFNVINLEVLGIKLCLIFVKIWYLKNTYHSSWKKHSSLEQKCYLSGGYESLLPGSKGEGTLLLLLTLNSHLPLKESSFMESAQKSWKQFRQLTGSLH